MIDFLSHSARWFSEHLESGEILSQTLIEASLEAIANHNPVLNAVVSLDADRAISRAKDIDRRRSEGEQLHPLAGLPIVIKDMEETADLRTTFGSPIYKNHVPTRDSLMVERLRGHGLVIIGKSNTPEFAMGSHTFNAVFGPTRNPWNLSRSAGGSSGGAAVAVAAGIVPFADGSDLGGSLRNPASFNNLVGFRPSRPFVPAYPSINPWSTMSVLGPIAKTVDDASLLLGGMVGHDARDPLSWPLDAGQFLDRVQRAKGPLRVAVSYTLGGLPVESAPSQAVRRAAEILQSMGCVIDEAEPSFAEVDETFETLRAHDLALRYRSMLEKNRDQIKPDAQWNIDQGIALPVEAIYRAIEGRTRIFHRMRSFLESYDAMLCPVSQLAPFPIEWVYPNAVAGQPMANYLEWMRSCTRISVTGHPAISLPCGFSDDGLPVGVQLVGRYARDAELLRLAHAYEKAAAFPAARPPATFKR